MKMTDRWDLDDLPEIIPPKKEKESEIIQTENQNDNTEGKPTVEQSTLKP